jgi:DNA end-binding protein Ku
MEGTLMPHGIWKGTMGFGLVSIAVEIYAVEDAERLDLDLLDKRDDSRIRYKKVNASTGAEVKPENIVKGYAVAKNRYVHLTDADLKSANPKATQTVDILGFIGRDDIDLIYFDRPYYVAPLKGSEKAYALLREALERTGQIGIAQIVLRTRQYVAAVYPYDEALVVHLLRYHDEIRSFSAIGKGEKGAAASPRPQELAMAEQLMKTMATEWDPTAYTDTYRRDVLKMIKQRAKGGGRKAKAKAAEEVEETPVLDLLAALKRSVERKGKSPARARRGGTRTRTAARKSA